MKSAMHEKMLSMKSAVNRLENKKADPQVAAPDLDPQSSPPAAPDQSSRPAAPECDQSSPPAAREATLPPAAEPEISTRRSDPHFRQNLIHHVPEAATQSELGEYNFRSVDEPTLS